MDRIKELALDIRAVKLAEPPKGSGQDSPALQAALKKAKAISAEKGSDSPEAKLAWEEVEEVAAASNENALGGMLLEDECLVETIEACEAIMELQRALMVNKEEGSRYQG
jgi:hypothetical protein